MCLQKNLTYTVQDTFTLDELENIHTRKLLLFHRSNGFLTYEEIPVFNLFLKKNEKTIKQIVSLNRETFLEDVEVDYLKLLSLECSFLTVYEDCVVAQTIFAHLIRGTPFLSLKPCFRIKKSGNYTLSKMIFEACTSSHSPSRLLQSAPIEYGIIK